MKNAFTLSKDGTTATIFLKRRNGDIVNCLVDAADLPKLQALHTTWSAQWDKDVRDFYALCGVRKDGKQSKLSMHRLIMDAPNGFQVDHLNHGTLDNRRHNLRVATQSVNMMNRRGAASNSKTGLRGISPYRTTGKFRLAVTINGKQEFIGYFSTIEDAIAVRNQFSGYN